MLCTIYRTKFQLNHHKKLSRVLWSIYDLEFDDPISRYNKPSHIRPLMKSYNFHFEPWECVLTSFDPENYKHWKFFERQDSIFRWRLMDLDFVNDDSAEWMPRNAMERLEISYTVYKMVDEAGHIVDTRPYIKKYFENRRSWYLARRVLYENLHKDDPAFCFQQSELRHPHTINELRQLPSPEDKRCLRENGYQFRIRESRVHLPSDRDNFIIDIPRCWKDRTKQRKQYNAKLRAKHKTCKGWPQ